MELREYIRLLIKNSKILLVSTIIFIVIALGISLRMNDKYVAQLTIYVQKNAEIPQSGDFTYDGYYAQLAAEAFTDTIVGLFESTTTSQKSLDLAGLQNDIAAVRSLHAKTKVEKVAPQLVEVTVTDVQREYAVKTVKSLFTVVEEEVSQIQRSDAEGLQVVSINTEPLVYMKKPLVMLNAIIAALVGVMVGVIAIAILVYAQEGKVTKA